MFEEFKVGDKVAIRTLYGNITTGYTVYKHDKVKLIIRDDVMGYFRTFSTRTGKEFHENTGWTAKINSHVISLEEANWSEIRAAANEGNLIKLKEKISDLEKTFNEN